MSMKRTTITEYEPDGAVIRRVWVIVEETEDPPVPAPYPYPYPSTPVQPALPWWQNPVTCSN